MLSQEQINSIAQILQRSIAIKTLRDDLLDHLCCSIEHKMKAGTDFTISFHEAITELAPDGLQKIQHETFFLLNATKLILMKKFMYAIGLLSAMSLAVGWIFSLLHLPGTFFLMVGGGLGFTFIYLPLLAMDLYSSKLRLTTFEKFQFGTGLASGLVEGISTIFKLLHLQGTVTLLLIAGVLFVFGFLPMLFLSMYRKSVAS